MYGIVKRHRGSAEIESALGKGTTIRLVFPKAVDTPTATLEEMLARRAPRRVLLVEDHADSREFMQALLESDGHTVEAVTTIEDAMARLGDNPEVPFDVLVSDIGLPDGSGWDLVTHARNRWPRLRIGVVTGWEPRGNTAATDFLLRKPVRTSDLLAQVAGSGNAVLAQ